MSTTAPEPRASGWAAQEVLVGLVAVARAARALVGATSLSDIAHSGLAEIREALQLQVATLYLPAASGRPKLLRYVTAARGDTAVGAAAEIEFDEEAWRLAVASGVPLVFHEEGGWLVRNPFEPAAAAWLVLPLASDGRLLGVVIGAAQEPLALEPTAAVVLTLIGDLLTAGIATAELRQALERTEVERERLRIASLVHDGLAQDLALAMRELALLDSGVDGELADGSRERLREAVASAHATVRERLKELAMPAPLGGIREAVGEICERHERRGLTVRLRYDGPDLQLAPAKCAALVRVLNEALTNVAKHAGAATVDVQVTVEDERLALVIRDDGAGFVVEAAAGADSGHLGLALMRERAREVGGTLGLTSRPGQGTLIRLHVPT